MKRAVVLLVLCLATATSHADARRAWIKSVPDAATWKHYSKVIGSDEVGKFIIDIKTNDIYFIDINLFNIHADFVLGVLLKQAWTADNVREYNRNYERVKPKFILGYLTHHLKIKKWTMAFWEGDKIGPDDVIRARKRLDTSFFIKDLPFRPDSPMQNKIAPEVARKGLKTITNDEVYKSSPFQAFTKGRAVGKLRVVPIGTLYENLTFARSDIVLLQESYPDITPVAGILATQFSTPLSHVNLRANSWRIPNAGDKKAREKFGALDGKTVYYEVTDTSAVLREATAAEIAELEGRIVAQKTVKLPPANLDNAKFAMLTRMRGKDATIYGAKSANLGEIVTANLEGVRVPAGFGVPLFF
ncbi:MAG: pyruvate, phosphate dikinase, partial [Deltaproteobacteria bacterium]|nr:pyruvate, phosphate dikinase [Deltaproteobacteria bacterium]